MSDTPSGEFFKRNSQLFTVLGVFAAISIYFTQLDLNSRWQRLGTVSSFTIFLLVAIAIQQNVTPPSSEKTPFDYVANQQWQRKGLAVFYVAFYAVVFSISVIVIRYSDTFFFLLSFLFFIGGVRATSKLIGVLEFPEEKPVIGESPEFPLMAAYVIRNSLYAAIIGGGGLAFVQISGFIRIEYIESFRISSPWIGGVVGFLCGLFVAGTVFTVLFISLVLIHFRFLHMKKSGSFEEFAELYKKTPWGKED